MCCARRAVAAVAACALISCDVGELQVDENVEYQYQLKLQRQCEVEQMEKRKLEQMAWRTKDSAWVARAQEYRTHSCDELRNFYRRKRSG